MQTDTCIDIFAVEFRYPHTAPFRCMLFDNIQAANEFKDYWAGFSDKRCVGAILKLHMDENELNNTRIYSSVREYINDITQVMNNKYVYGGD